MVRLCLVIVQLLSLLIVNSTLAAQEMQVARTLALRAAARADALVSGEIEYVHAVAFKGSEQRSSMLFRFMGKSWLLRYLDTGENVMLCHQGKSVELISTKQSDGSTRFSCRIGASRKFDAFSPAPPYFAGSFWFRATAEFVKENAEHARWVKTQEIDGVQTQVLEWDLEGRQILQAFHSVSDLASKKATLRVHVAPQFGFAIPRVEYLGDDNTPASIMLATGFHERSPGLFLPTECSKQDFKKNGPLFSYTYTLNNFKFINETLPEGSFSTTLPNGTSVIDGRSGSAFIIGQKTYPTVADIDDVINNFKT